MSNTFKVKGRSANYKLSEVIFLFSLHFLVSDQLGIVENDSIKRRWQNTYLLMDGFSIYVSVPIKTVSILLILKKTLQVINFPL